MKMNKNIILKHKKIKQTTYLLIVFNNYGMLNYSIGERHNYKVPNNREIDYWENAEYYNIDSLDNVLKIFNSIK